MESIWLGKSYFYCIFSFIEPDHLPTFWCFFYITERCFKYYDDIAGTNLQNEMREKRRLMTSKTETAFVEYGLRIDTEPSKLKAKILREPTIKFDDRFARVTNGSFDLRGVKFAR